VGTTNFSAVTKLYRSAVEKLLRHKSSWLCMRRGCSAWQICNESELKGSGARANDPNFTAHGLTGVRFRSCERCMLSIEECYQLFGLLVC
jgi:hypothetical protein